MQALELAEFWLQFFAQGLEFEGLFFKQRPGFLQTFKGLQFLQFGQFGACRGIFEQGQFFGFGPFFLGQQFFCLGGDRRGGGRCRRGLNHRLDLRVAFDTLLQAGIGGRDFRLHFCAEGGKTLCIACFCGGNQLGFEIITQIKNLHKGCN